MYKITTNNSIEQLKNIIFFGRTRFWQEGLLSLFCRVALYFAAEC